MRTLAREQFDDYVEAASGYSATRASRIACVGSITLAGLVLAAIEAADSEMSIYIV